MSEPIKHECGIVLLRLLKPLEYYQEKYGTDRYPLRKLCLLMEKQHNRGQEGAGIGCVRLDSPPGEEYIFRSRAMGKSAIAEVFDDVNSQIARARGENPAGPVPFMGHLYLGHLRYSTTGRSGMSYTHPFLRRNNWKSKNLCLAGNFNLTNVDEILEAILATGQHPRHNADTFMILEQLGSLMDEQVQQLYDKFKKEGARGVEMSRRIEEALDMESVVREASAIWDGGYVITGATGSGDSFIFRDPWGIRTAHYYMDDEIFVAASERAVIQTVMNVDTGQVREIAPGEGLFIKRDGTLRSCMVRQPSNDPRPCSFERIYFSRGSDADIYRERKRLGKLLTPAIMESVDGDIDNTVFSYIPNTAEIAFYGMMNGLEEEADRRKAAKLATMQGATPEQIFAVLSHRVRTEKLAVKDIKLRTFIAEGISRDDMAAHVYDTTYGTVVPDTDSIVVIDDSIVRGTTLKRSIIQILSRLRPKRIVIVSSSPQVRYPDCYGIDMSNLTEFIAFHAAISLLQESGRQNIIDRVYRECKAQEDLPKEEMVNCVKQIYEPFTDREISDRIAELVTPQGCRCEIKVVYQSIDDLHRACPEHRGDWYFSGDYPTAGGVRTVVRSFINYYEKSMETGSCES